MRCYFDLSHNSGIIPDEIGLDVPDLDAAERGARKAIDDLRREMPSSRIEWSGWRLQITDENGLVLKTIFLDGEEDPRLEN